MEKEDLNEGVPKQQNFNQDDKIDVGLNNLELET